MPPLVPLQPLLSISFALVGEHNTKGGGLSCTKTFAKKVVVIRFHFYRMGDEINFLANGKRGRHESRAPKLNCSAEFYLGVSTKSSNLRSIFGAAFSNLRTAFVCSNFSINFKLNRIKGYA